MTFTEAAVEVLRLAGKPLHFKKITELAIEKNLLSHVGKTPEVTMSARLAALVKRDANESPIIKVKPGVFGLRDFGREVIAAAEAEPTDENEEIDVDLASSAGEDEAPPAEATPRPAQRLPGQDVFPEEEDDDEPILGRPEEARAAEEGGGAAGDERRGRRRRRRRGRRDDAPGAEPGAEAVSNGNSQAPHPAHREGREHGRDREHGRERDRERNRDRGGEHRGSETGRGEHGRASVGPLVRGDWTREPGDGELAGKDLADAACSILAGLDRQPQGIARIAELLVQRGRLAGDATALAPTVAAALRADSSRREAEDGRARIRFVGGGRVVLTDWSLPQEALRFEQDAIRAADRQRDQVRQAFLRKVRELPPAGFAELVASWLNAEGVVALRAVRRPGAQPGELHLAGTLKRGIDETRLAIVARRDGREVGRERVIELRGALHYYGSASVAWLVSAGPVLSGAREEAAVPGVPPVSIFDGIGFARALERARIGLRSQSIPLSTIDFDLLEALRGDYREEPRREQAEHRRDQREPREQRDESEITREAALPSEPSVEASELPRENTDVGVTGPADSASIDDEGDRPSLGEMSLNVGRPTEIDALRGGGDDRIPRLIDEDASPDRDEPVDDA